MKTEKSEIQRLLRKIYSRSAVMTAAAWCVTLIWGFRLGNLLGFMIGYGYMCLCMSYLGRTCEKAVELDEKKAKKSMLVCYILRYAGLFALCAAAMLTGAVSGVCVLVPQFFPRIALSLMQFCERKDKC